MQATWNGSIAKKLQKEQYRHAGQQRKPDLKQAERRNSNVTRGQNAHNEVKTAALELSEMATQLQQLVSRFQSDENKPH